MKKGIALSVNFVIIAIISVTVILIVSALFSRGYISGTRSISRTELRTRCTDLCLLDRYSQRTNVGENSCYTNPPSIFSERSYTVDSEEIHCYDIVDCYVDTEYGVCYFDEVSGISKEEICSYAADDLSRLKKIGLCV